MKKTWTKVLALLCAATACAPIAGCGGGGDNGIDNTKTQLFVFNYDGGVGHKWLDAVVARFEKDFAETEFTEGKKGVQIHQRNDRTSIEQLVAKMSTSREEVFFAENVNYYNCIAEGAFLDITDIMEKPLTEYGETESIVDKLYPDQRDFYQASNGRYYAMPHAQSPTLITYDADLFDKHFLFFDQEGELTKRSTDEGKSYGADNLPGTYDDGLPATYEEFYTLCDTMIGRGIAPMTWSGMYEFYMTRFSAQLRADFDGAEADVAYNLNGTMSKLVDTIDEDGNVTYKDPVTIVDNTNGYEIFSSASYYYTFKFFEDIYTNEYYFSKSFNTSVSHTDAQKNFLLSRFSSKVQDIGMLVEGLYWVNESSSAFADMESYANSSLQERNLRIMPLPKATGAQVGEQTTVVDSLNQMAFISAYIDEDKKELAKTFLRYCETQKSLEEFVQTTNLTRNFKVDYSNIYDDLAPYTQSIIDFLGGVRYLMPASDNPIFQKNYTALADDYQMGTISDPDPMIAIKSGKTAEQLFNAFRSKYNANTWKDIL